MTFDQLNLIPALLKAISEQGYSSPTPVQEQAIPVILRGKDVLAGAQTGTGKTAGFALPLLQKLAEGFDPQQTPRRIRALVLVPTRELATQVTESFLNYGAHLPLHTEMVVGGLSFGQQAKHLHRSCDILVATTGRLLDHLKQRTVNLSQVEYLVLDEADRMLDMGFLPDIKHLLNFLPKQRQNLLFSATFPTAIKGLATQLLNNPVEVAVSKQNTTADTVSELVYGIAKEYKRELL
ncbi:partial ATP-dependent RNA helicase RhlE, partial [Patescibacteria group bacterium]